MCLYQALKKINDNYISIEVQLQELVSKEQHGSEQKFCLVLDTCKKWHIL
jgi:hypothetical protein